MADDRNPTPGAPRSTAPPVDSPPAAESDDDTSSGTAEIAELVITSSDADGSAVTTDAPTHNGPAPAPASPATPAAGPATDDGDAASKAAADGSPPAAPPKPIAAAPTPAPAPSATPPPRALSNETPTITRPAPRPAPVPRPAPASATAPPPATPLRPPPAATTPARPQADWAAEVADRIDEVVAKVRANTSERLVGIARMVVFGLLAAVMGVTALVLLTILFFRLLALIPGPLWAAYLVLGAILVGFGVFCWSRRTPKSHPA